jgi:hypothetical protein
VSHARGGQDIGLSAQKAPKWTKFVILPQSYSVSISINQLKSHGIYFAHFLAQGLLKSIQGQSSAGDVRQQKRSVLPKLSKG